MLRKCSSAENRLPLSVPKRNRLNSFQQKNSLCLYCFVHDYFAALIRCIHCVQPPSGTNKNAVTRISFWLIPEKAQTYVTRLVLDAVMFLRPMSVSDILQHFFQRTDPIICQRLIEAEPIIP